MQVRTEKEEEQIAAYNAEAWARRKPFLDDVLAHGLPSLRGGGAGGSSGGLQLHPVRRVSNVSSTEFEKRCGAASHSVPLRLHCSSTEFEKRCVAASLSVALHLN